jgi:predicted lipid-binding transport protein (Tim44 family)
MSDINTAPTTTPKANRLASFFSGMMSGGFTGAMMMGIYALVALTGLVTAMAPLHVLGMIAVTSLFSGTMAAIHGNQHARSNAAESNVAMVPVMMQAGGPSAHVAMDAADDMASPQRGDGKSWAETTTRGNSSQSRIQQIINNNAMSDKDRASAILAARDAATADAGRA